jgi:hypothetical protein
LDQIKKLKSLSQECVDLGPIFPPYVMYDEYMKDVQEELINIVDRNCELTFDNVESEKHLKQASSKPFVKIQLRISTRERLRYSVDLVELHKGKGALKNK